MSNTLKAGVATIALLMATALPAFATIEDVGGGTWNHGTSYTFPTTKNVWSHYVHPSKKHSGTAICGSSEVKVTKNATIWANADAHCSWTQEARAYWNTY